MVNLFEVENLFCARGFLLQITSTLEVLFLLRNEVRRSVFGGSVVFNPLRTWQSIMSSVLPVTTKELQNWELLPYEINYKSIFSLFKNEIKLFIFEKCPCPVCKVFNFFNFAFFRLTLSYYWYLSILISYIKVVSGQIFSSKKIILMILVTVTKLFLKCYKQFCSYFSC